MRPAPAQWGSQRLQATLSFAYDDAIVPRDRPSTGVFQGCRSRGRGYSLRPNVKSAVPAAIVTYCFPSRSYVIGPAFT